MNFLCGTYFKHQCGLQLTDYKNARESVFVNFQNESLENNLVFCKPEYLSLLNTYVKIGSVKLPDQFDLVTHNSDINFSAQEISYVLDLFPNINNWYTQNLVSEHPKLKPIPIGIANPKWSHGNQLRFLEVMSEKQEKTKKIYVNFNVSTNPPARYDCLKKISDHYPLHKQKNYPNAVSIQDHNNFVESTQKDYLRDIAKSYFTVSPIGNGFDCHKTWEAIYMKSVPIVTRWHGVEIFKKLGIPILIIDDWSDLKDLDLSPDVYNKLWQDFKPSSLNFEFFK
tara:strand:- start:118 stop:963 length:846 start_codon:yes stop_codon:yes gene_type:complete